MIWVGLGWGRGFVGFPLNIGEALSLILIWDFKSNLETQIFLDTFHMLQYGGVHLCNLQTTLLCYNHIPSFFWFNFFIATIINSSIFHGPSQFGIAMMLVMFDVDGEIGAKKKILTSKILFETDIGFNLSSLISLPFVSHLFATTTFLSLPLSLSESFDPFFPM